GLGDVVAGSLQGDLQILHLAEVAGEPLAGLEGGLNHDVEKSGASHARMSFGNNRRLGTAGAARMNMPEPDIRPQNHNFREVSSLARVSAARRALPDARPPPHEAERYLFAAVIAAFCSSSVRPR